MPHGNRAARLAGLRVAMSDLHVGAGPFEDAEEGRSRRDSVPGARSQVEPGSAAAATIQNAADEMSPGTRDVTPQQRLSPAQANGVAGALDCTPNA